MKAEPIKKVLFVCGIGRSGTTILVKMLSSHPEIVMGIERYRKLYSNDNKIARWHPHLYFDKEKFFDFADNLTGVVPSRNQSIKDRP